MARWIVLPVLAVPVLLGLFWPLGWTDTRLPVDQVPEVAPNGSYFSNECGTIIGKVIWEGIPPTAEPILAPPSPRGDSGASGPRKARINPRLPEMNKDKELAGAVVLLLGVDPRRSRPWDRVPTRLEVRGSEITVIQEDRRSSVGFLQRGQSVEFVSRDPFFHSLLLRGSAFWGLPLPDANQVLTRRFNKPGVVEITSGSGCFWMLAHLFVSDTPYQTLTDCQGCFTLDQVPSGTYDLVVWHPDWREIRREYDGDSWEIASIRYRPPLRLLQTVTVQAGQRTTVNPTFTSHHISRGGYEPPLAERWNQFDLQMPLDPHSRDE